MPPTRQSRPSEPDLAQPNAPQARPQTEAQSGTQPAGPDTPVNRLEGADDDEVVGEAEPQSRKEALAAEREQRKAEKAAAEADPATPGVPGPTGTVTGPENRGTLRVDVHSNVTLGGRQVNAFERDVEVPDDSEARAALSVGHVTLVEDRDSDDS